MGKLHCQSVKKKNRLDLHHFGILDSGFGAEAALFFQFRHARRGNSRQFCDFGLGEAGHFPAHSKVCKFHNHNSPFEIFLCQEHNIVLKL